MEEMSISLVIYILFFSLMTMFSYLLSRNQTSSNIELNIFTLKNKIIYVKGDIFCFTVIIIMIFAVFSGLRDNVGTDYQSYRRIYNGCVSADNIFSYYAETGTEIGFILLCKLANYLFHDYWGVLFLSAFLTICFSLKGIKRFAGNANLALMIFVFIVLYLAPSFNIIRQIMAASIIFFGFKYIEERKIIKYILITIAASFFHLSALFCIVLYFVYVDDARLITVRETLALCISLLLPLFFDNIFYSLSNLSIFTTYTDVYNSAISYQANWGAMLIHLPIILMIFLNWRQLVLINKRNKFYILLFVLEIVSIVMGFYMHWAMRMGYYFFFSEVVLVPQVINSKKKTLKWILGAATILYYLWYFYTVYYLWGNDGIFPYNSIL